LIFTKNKIDHCQWLLVMSAQLIGFSIGGIFKRFVVAPPSMIWPHTLLTAVLFNTLHDQETSGARTRGGISRKRFFYYVFIGYIFYSQFILPWKFICAARLLLFLDFLPSYLFTALSPFRGFAGWLQTMPRSTSSLGSGMGWAWVFSPSTGVK
jgi:hypothetical protein